jgi:CDP-2,3-bis-(O-geranylgeranyl)-sn-glycerol synthase
VDGPVAAAIAPSAKTGRHCGDYLGTLPYLQRHDAKPHRIPVIDDVPTSVGLQTAARALLLLVLANTAPWAAGRLLGQRWAYPLDLGWVLLDGRRLFGSHKTWRGVVTGTALCAVVAPWLGLSWTVGAYCGALSLLGDALSSSIKRRMALAPGTDVPGLDQLPEALLPMIVLAPALELGVVAVAAVALVFLLLNLFWSVRRWR